MSEVGWYGWAAGIVDGEGTIGIYPQKGYYVKKDGSKSTYDYKRCVVALQNTSEEMILKLMEIIGGGYYETFPKNATKRTWRWYLNIQDMPRVLPKLLPYLVVKQDATIKVLEYLST